MKKLLYIAFGLCAILASCAKEIDPIPAENPGNNEKTVLPANIPASLTALYAEEASQNEVEAVPKVKTSYGSDGSFSWVLSDEVALYFVDNLDAPENQGWISYEASTVNGATATFTVKDGQTAKATALSEYKNTGLAIYPTSIARPASANSESCSAYGSPFVTVKSTVSGNASDIILIGSADATPVFHFKTAMGVLKVAITGIPAQAAALQLISNDQDSYPLCGDFKLNIDGDLEIKKADYLKYYGDHTGDNKLTIDLSSEGDIASRDFYFNIPTGNYAKGAFTIKIVDGSGNALLEKTLNKAFEFERNDLVLTPELANEWVTLGVGKYADYWMQGIMGAVEDMWDVTIQKSTAANTYRIINPYSKGVEMKQTTTHGDYLSFTIVDASNITFNDYVTGVAYSSEHNFKLKYVSSSTQNKVILGTAETPQVIQLAPDYTHDSESEWNWPRNTLPFMIRIVMPDFANSLTGDASFTGNVNQCKFNTSAGASVTYDFGVSKNNYPQIIKDKQANALTPSVSSDASLYWTNKSGNQNATCSSDQLTGATTPISSGPIYVIWYTKSGGTILTLGSKRMYFLSTADANSIISQYVRDLTIGSYVSGIGNLDVHGDNTITIAQSNDPTKGNIMITEFAGFNYDISESTFSTFGYDFSKFADGSPIYGVYGGNIVHDGKAGAQFSNINEQTFYYDANGSAHNIGTGQSAQHDLLLAFNTTKYWNTSQTTGSVSHDLVVWHPFIENCYGNSLTSYDFYFQGYTAFKTKGMITLTGSMLSTNSSYGEGGAGDAGGMAALVDKNADTRWHSNYNGSIATDNHGIYIQINLSSISKTVKDFTLKFLSRGDASHGLPSKYRVAVSNNGTDWSFLTEDIPITATSGTWYQKSLSAGANYSYIRLCITEINHNNSTEETQTLTNTYADGIRYTHLAEIQLWEN